MGSWLIFQHRFQVRRGDGVLKVIRVLDIPVYERRRLTGKSVNGSPRRRIEVERSTEVTEWASRKSL
jgi:hypothetical protein